MTWIWVALVVIFAAVIALTAFVGRRDRSRTTFNGPAETPGDRPDGPAY